MASVSAQFVLPAPGPSVGFPLSPHSPHILSFTHPRFYSSTHLLIYSSTGHVQKKLPLHNYPAGHF
jgi:hypothetical protein